MPLDPDRLTPAASLNRTRIVGLPGVALDASIRGKAASDVLSAGALAAQVRGSAPALGLDALRDALDTDLLPAFAACFASRTPAVCAAADAIACKFGRALGALILMLRRGDRISREARPDWDASYWDHWAGLRTVWLGGGLMAGAFGERVCNHAAVTLAEDHAHSCDLRRAAYPALLPLIGAACSLPSPPALRCYDKPGYRITLERKTGLGDCVMSAVLWPPPGCRCTDTWDSARADS